MKKCFRFLLSLLFILSPMTSRAVDICGDDLFLFKDLFDTFKTSCENKSGDELCGCLNSASEKNVLAYASWNDKDALKKEIEENKIKQTKNLLQVYQQITYGASYQRFQMMMDQDKEAIGCTKEDIVKYFSEGIKNKLEADNKELGDKLKGCKGNCKDIEKQLKVTQEELKDIDRKIGLSCDQAVHLLDGSQGLPPPPTVSDRIKELESVKTWYQKNGPLKRVEEVHDLIVELKKSLEQGASNFSCPLGEDPYKGILTQYKLDLNSKSATYKNLILLDKVDTEAPISKMAASVENMNLKLQEKMQKEFNDVPKNGCYTYGEYKSFKSLPSMELLSGLSNTENVDKFFALPAVPNPSDAEKINFLRANPVLGSLLSSPQSSAKLARILKSFAGKNRNEKDQSKLMKNYAELLKGQEMKDLLSEADSQNANINSCRELSMNLSAIVSSDDPGVPPEGGISNDLELINKNRLACKMKEGTNSSAALSLMLNPQYVIYGDDRKDSPDGRDPEYLAALEIDCAGYEAEVKGKLDHACRKEANKVACLSKLRNSDMLEKLRANFLKHKKPELHKLIAAVQKNTKTKMTANDHKRVAQINKDEYQNKAAKKNFDEKVLPTLSTKVIAKKGQEDEYKASKQPSNKSVDSSNEYMASSSDGTPTIREPDWAAPAPSTPLNRNTLSEVKNNPNAFLNPSFPTMPLGQQASALKEFKKKLESDGRDIVEKEKDDDEKSKLRDDLKKAIAKVDEKEREVASLGKGKNTQEMSPQSAHQITNSKPAQTSGSSISGNSSATASTAQNLASVNLPTMKSQFATQAASKQNDALLKTKYQENGRSPASISTGLNVVADGATDKLVPKEAVLSGSIPLSSSEFNNKAVLTKKVEEELIARNIPHGQDVLFKFYDKTKNEVLIVNVSWMNDKWVMKSVPRKSLLNNLKLTLDETKH